MWQVSIEKTLFASILPTLIRAQDESIGCFVEGECVQSPIAGSTSTQSAQDCLQYCQVREDKSYYYLETTALGTMITVKIIFRMVRVNRI